MRPKLAAFGALVVGTLLALALTASSAPAGDAPNQGDPDKVLKVDNPNVWCEDAEPGKKVEGGLGRKIRVWAKDPIDFVTVKSGKNAEVVFAEFDEFWGKIKLSKDVSNYVVWTCPKEPPTTTTSTTTTTTSTTTTDY
jgi:hypothetical protein